MHCNGWYLAVLRHYEAVIYVIESVQGIDAFIHWTSGDLVRWHRYRIAIPNSLTHWQTLKDRATQLLISIYTLISGALATQYISKASTQHMDSRLSEEWPFYSRRLIDMPVSDVGPFKLLLLTFQRNIVNNSQGWERSPQMSVRPTLSLTWTSNDHCPAFISNVTDSFCTHWWRLGMKLDFGELIVSW